MAAAKKKKRSSSKGGSKTNNNKSRPVSSETRSSTSSSGKRAVSTKGGTSSAQRKAFMRGARSRGGLGTWGLVGLLGALVVFAVLYFSGALSSGMPAEISVAEAYEVYPDGAFFLDVREVVEWDAGHVPDTINIPLSELESRVSELPEDQDIVVICRSGNRSAEGRDILLDADFKNVTSMAGGMREWKEAGYPYDGEILE